MGALRKIMARTLVPAVPAVPPSPPTTQCTFVPDEPQFNPPPGGGNSGGGSSCVRLPVIQCRPATLEEAEAGLARDGFICTSVRTIEVCN